jgi:hypothetical protein
LPDGQGFFPGSSQPLAPPAGLPEFVQIPQGKSFTINGKSVELLTIGQVAEVLQRQPVTLRKWERLGTIPKATFVKPGANKDPRGRRRLYSRPQVEALLRIAMEEKILYNPNLQISKTQFTRKVFEAFKELQKQ